MKTLIFKRKGIFTFLSTGILAAVMLLSSCIKDDTPNNNSQMYTTSGNASGSQENPSNASTATGSLSGTYNATTNVWQYSINWTNMSTTATAVEIHGPADVGINAALNFALAITTGGVTGSASGSMTLSAQQEIDMLAGKLYYTILSATYISGEIRGQITATAQ